MHDDTNHAPSPMTRGDLISAMGNAIKLAALIAAALLAGCATVGEMRLTKDADRQLACVAVQWTPREQIASLCGRDPVFGYANQACLMDGYMIVSTKPRDWYDEPAMISLGHELYHALGARHD